MSSGPRQLVTTSPKRNVRQCLSAFPLTPWKSPKNVDCSNASPMTVSLVVRLGGVLAVFVLVVVFLEAVVVLLVGLVSV